MVEEEFDLERQVQERLKKKKGLIELHQKSHPGSTFKESRKRIDLFTRESKEAQSSDRENWQRQFFEETGHCSPGATPQYERMRPTVQDVRQWKRPLLYPLQPPKEESDLERLQRENQELKKALHDALLVIKKLEKRLGE